MAGVTLDIQGAVLLVLFRSGSMPRFEDLRTADTSSMHDLSAPRITRLHDRDAEERFTLSTNGVTFRLRSHETDDGLLDIFSRSAREQLSDELGVRFSAWSLRAESNIARGALAAPVLQAQLRAGSLLALAEHDCLGLCWVPSRIVAPPSRVLDLVDAWQTGNRFPIDLFVAFVRDLDGGQRSRGLALFTGQELRLEPSFSPDDGLALQTGRTIAEALIELGTVEDAIHLRLPDKSNYRLEPSPNGRFVRAIPH